MSSGLGFGLVIASEGAVGVGGTVAVVILDSLDRPEVP